MNRSSSEACPRIFHLHFFGAQGLEVRKIYIYSQYLLQGKHFCLTMEEHGVSIRDDTIPSYFTDERVISSSTELGHRWW